MISCGKGAFWRTAFRIAAGKGLLPVFGVLAVGAVARAAVLELLPSLSSQRFGREAETYGLLMGAFGVGALIGSIFMLWRGRTPNARAAILWQAVMAGGVIGLGLSTSLALSMTLNLIAGFSFMVSVLRLETLLLTRMPDARRGVTSSAFGLCNLGAISLAGFFGGLLAEILTMPNTFALFGALALAGTLVFLIRRKGTQPPLCRG